MSFRDHLRADQHGALRVAKALDRGADDARLRGSVGVEAKQLQLGQVAPQLRLEPLRPRADPGELVVRMADAGVERPWLRVYAANPRGRAFWEKVGWSDTGERALGAMPPHAEQLIYAYDPASSGTGPIVAP